MSESLTTASEAAPGSDSPAGTSESAPRDAKGPSAEVVLRSGIQSLLDSASSPKERRQAFRAAVRHAKRHWPAIATLIRELPCTVIGEVQARQWLLCELFLARCIVNQDELFHIDESEESKTVVRVVTLLGRSPFVSDASFPSGLDKNLKVRRQILADAVADALGAHELLSVGDDNAWPSPADTVSGFDLLRVGRAVIEHFASADAPLARELIAREQLVELRQRGKELSRKEIGRLPRGRSVLESILRKPEAAFSDMPGAAAHFARRVRIAAFVGRQFGVWATFDKARVKLLATAPEESAALERWSELVALTHGPSKGVTRIIDELPDRAVVVLLGAAVRHRLGALADRLKDVVLFRINRQLASPELFDGVLRLGRDSPELSRWVQRTVAPHASVAEAQGSSGAGEQVILAHVRSGNLRMVMDEQFLQQVGSVVPQVRVVILAVAANRLEEELPMRSAVRIEQAASELRRLLSALSARQEELRRLLGSVPRGIDAVFEETRGDINAAAESLVSAAPAAINRRAAPRIEPVVYTGDEEITDSLHRLVYDPTRSETDWRTARAGIQQRLAWIARNEPRAAARVADIAATLPPEALGALWEAGVASREPALLTSVGPILDSVPAAADIWADVLLGAAVTADTPVPLDDATASRSCALIGARVQALITRMSAPEPTGVIDRALSAGKSAAQRALVSVRDLAQEVSILGERPLTEQR